MIKQESYLTVLEISNILRLSALTIYKYIKSGKLQAVEFGGHYRVAESSLHEFIKDHRSPRKKGKSNE